MVKIVVIIPTYKEGSSIGKVIDSLESEFKLILNHQMSILVVDANSPDNTAEIVNSKKDKYKNVELITEKKKRGLGMAYIDGMNCAISHLGADAFIEFDGDFQHDPKDVKRLVAEFDNGYDYVIGSRYVAGGEVPKHWAFYRKLLSKFGSLTAKWILGIKTNDNTSGLKLTKVSGFANKLPLDENKILSKRHAYKLHLLYEMINMGAKVKEIPIKFLERERGSSKSSIEDIFESLKVIIKLRLK